MACVYSTSLWHVCTAHPCGLFVQHFPVSFEMIVDAFLNENQLRVEQVKLDGCLDHGYKLKDPELLDRWRAFHRSQAHYRVISTDEAMDQDNL